VIFRPCRGKGERAGILIDAERHQRCLIRSDGDALFPDYIRQDRRACSDLMDDLKIAFDIIIRGGMVIIDMYLKVISVQESFEFADPLFLTRIDQDESVDFIEINISYPEKVEQIRR